MLKCRSHWNCVWMGMLLSVWCLGAGVVSAKPKAKDIALSFVKHSIEGRYKKAVAMMHPRMKAALDDARLKLMVDGLKLQLGDFKSLGDVKMGSHGVFHFGLVTVHFSRKSLIWRVVVDGKGQVAGLQFLPTKKRPSGSKSKKSERVPPYAKRSLFHETSVVIGTKWKLKGTLSTPKTKGLKPAVILVHGSGPHDQDETIGPNKVFRDVAWGLASQGVTVLRYTKRTRALRAQFKKNKKLASAMADVENEVTDDVGHAIALLKSIKGVDPNRIFVLGHSLGGMLAPAIAVKYPSLAGIILMAGAYRPLEELVLDQYLYIFSSDGKISKGERKILKELMKMIITLRSNLTLKTPTKKLPLHIPAKYWLSLQRNDPAKLITKVKQSVLVLQGGRDYQVTVEDFNLWKKALKGRKDVKFHLYPSLNHLFITGKGPSLPGEYGKPGFVHGPMIKDVATWVLGTSKKSATPPTTRTTK
ncbi:MAG: alpha/beta fold hydrolase [Deltaproteobacteria bacterium]|nr:MAG: alpha/beta fold hydrolase [Deltaproteobacteria bacterium]